MELILDDQWLDDQDFVKTRKYIQGTKLNAGKDELEGDKDYAIACASMEKMVPGVSSEETLGFFNQLIYYKTLTWLQTRHLPTILDQVHDSGDLGFLEDVKKPRIYCTFHLGSYRMIPISLLKNNVDLAIVLAKDTLAEQSRSISKAHEELKKKLGLSNTLEFINAEDSSGVINMIKAIKNGKSLLFYIDGNTGVGGKKVDQSKLLPVNFLGGVIDARKGVAYIAHKYDVPIVLMLCHYVDDENMEVKYYPPILPEGKESEASIKDTLQKIYDLFSEELVKYPSQWEGWLYVQDMLSPGSFKEQGEGLPPLDPQKTYHYNKKRFSYFQYRGRECILDKEIFQVYPVEKELIEILESQESFRVDLEVLPRDIFGFLYEKRFFI